MRLQNIHNKGRFVYIFERLEDGSLKVTEDKDFFPYYFEPSDTGTFNTYDGKKARKVVAGTPYDVSKNRSNQSYESDVLYPKRYILDKIPIFEKTVLKYFFIDIEILCKDFPDVETASDTISCITIYNSWDTQYITWYLAEWESEKDMIEDVVSFIAQEKPDVISAWNIDFDYTYMFNRYPQLFEGALFSEAISPILQCRPGKKGTTYPAGLSIVDYQGLYDKLTRGKRVSYALDFIAQVDLGEQEWGETVFGELNEHTKEKNLNDVKRMVRLEEKFKVLANFDEIRRFCRCYWEDLAVERTEIEGRLEKVSNNSKIIDMLVLKEAKNLGIVLPKKPGEDELSGKFEGAYRDSLAVGRFFSVGKYDLSGAYLFAITDFCLDSHNILSNPTEETLPLVVTDRKTNTALEIHHVRQNKNALLPIVIEKLLLERNRYRILTKQTSTDSPEYKNIEEKYQAVKTIVLSAWGVIGNKYFRLFDNRIASLITSIVRDLLKFVMAELEILGYKVIYADTDSIFCDDKGNNIQNILNELVQKWAKTKFNKISSITFEYEGHFEKILILAKCHYYGYLKTAKGAKKEIRGVEVKRSSSSKYEASFQEELINKVLDKENQDSIKDWIKNEKDRVKTLSLDEVGFPCKIKSSNYKNEPIFVRAYKNSKEVFPGWDVNKGELFNYIFVHPHGYDSTGKPRDVLAINKAIDPKKIKINWDEIIRRTIINKSRSIFEAMGWGDVDNLITGQTSLF